MICLKCLQENFQENAYPFNNINARVKEMINGL